jgi:hypothetical protein
MYSYVNKYPSEVNIGSNFGACAITPDGSTLAVGGERDSNIGINTGRIVVYNTNDFSIKGNIIRGPTNGSIGTTVAINDAGNRVFATCGDETARVYEYSSGTWTLMFTTPTTPSDFFGLSIRCNSVGDKFFYTQGNNDLVSFYSYDGSAWSGDTSRNALPSMASYSWVSDCDSSMNNIVGTTEDPNVNALVATWNGSAWAQRGSALGGGTHRYVGCGMSSDGDTVALFNWKFTGGSTVDVFDWNTSTSDWVARTPIYLNNEINRGKIAMSTDKNTISFCGEDYTSLVFGVWTWDSGTASWTQELQFFPHLSANIPDYGQVALRDIAMSGDKTLVACPYTNYDYGNSIFESGFATFIRTPVSPLVEPHDDGTYVFNVHPTSDTALTGVPTLSSNDDYTSPQPDQSGTFTLYNNDPEVSVNGSNALVVSLNHPLGAYEIGYRVTDQNNNDSELATINYVVVNFGIHLPDDTIPPISDVVVNTPTTIVTAAFINDVLSRITDDLESVPDLEISFTLTSGSAYATTASRSYTVAELLTAPITSPPFGDYRITPTEAGPEEVNIAFEFNGWTFNLQQNFDIVEPPVPSSGGAEIFPAPVQPPTPVIETETTAGISAGEVAGIAIAAVISIIAILILLGVI